MSRMHMVIVMVTGAVAAGCAVAPTVEYAKIDATARHPLTADQFDTYYLQASKVTIDVAAGATKSNQNGTTPAPAPAPKPKKATMLGGNDAAPTPAPQPEATVKASDITVTSTPVENTAFLLALSHSDPFWASTTLSITKIENTNLVKDIGVDVADHRVEYINAAAAVVTKAAGLMLGDRNTQSHALDLKRLPVELDLAALLASGDTPQATTISLQDRDDIAVALGPVPPDAEPLANLTFPLTTGRYLHSACRALTVTFTLPGAAEPVSRTVKIADPNYVEFAGLPSKGKITMHSECGISVSTDSGGASGDASVIQALATQGKAIADALAAAGKPNGK